MSNKIFNSIPNDLKGKAKFCVWGYRMKDGRQTKIPFNPTTGLKAKSNDANTFGSFKDAIEAYSNNTGKYSGIGIGIFDNLVGIDIDDCVDNDGNISSMAQDIIQTINSYVEWSPSHSGIHIYCYSNGLKYDKSAFYIKNSSLKVELYIAGSTNRYLTITGDSIYDLPIRECSNEILSVAEKYMKRDSTISTMDSNECESDMQSILTDSEVVTKMLCSKNSEKVSLLWEGNWHKLDLYGSASEADLALCDYLAFYTRKDVEQMDRIFRLSGLWRPEKWDALRGDMTYGAMTIAKACSNCTSVWSPGYTANYDTGVEAALEFLKNADITNNNRYTAMDDIASGYLLAEYCRPFARPIPESKGWIIYDGVRWSEEKANAVVEEAAKDLAKALKIFSIKFLTGNDTEKYMKWAGSWGSRSKRKTIIADASSVYPVSRSEFDNNPYLLNLNNGTLDISKYPWNLLEHNPGHLITQLAPVDYDPNATSPKWESFISEIMDPCDITLDDMETERIRTAKANFLKRFLGYSLTGSTREETLLLMYGSSSRNGKSVFVEAVKSLMGTYSKTVNIETLLLSRSRDSSGPSEDIARLAGARIAIAGEVPENAKLDAARIKSLTGGDTLTARKLGENSYEFSSCFKIILHSNHLPSCSDQSVFNSGRILVLPFNRHFEPDEQDKNLKTLFREPGAQSAILNWMLSGLREYQQIGLAAPDVVVEATNKYKADNDRIRLFINEVLEQADDYIETSADIYTAYKLWCKANGGYPESSIKFKHNLENAGIHVEQCRPSKNMNPTSAVRNYKITDEYKLNII